MSAMVIIRRTFVMCFVLIALAISTAAQSTSQFDDYGRWVNGVSEPWFFERDHPKEEVLLAQQKWSDLENDLKRTSQHRWQGDYFEGSSTHGDYFRWSKAGFVWLKVDKCRATVMSFSYGQVAAGPTSIQLVPQKTIGAKSSHHRHHDFASVKFLPVIWSKDLLLVPQHKIAAFGDYVAGLGRYNQWLFFGEDGPMFLSRARPNDDEYPMAEAPIVPPGYQRFIKRPIQATVHTIEKPYVRRSDSEWWDHQIIPVSLKLSRVGARPNLKFRIDGSDELIELTSVAGKTAKGKIVRPTRKKPCVKLADDDDCLDPEFEEIKVGVTASTRPATP